MRLRLKFLADKPYAPHDDIPPELHNAVRIALSMGFVETQTAGLWGEALEHDAYRGLLGRAYWLSRRGKDMLAWHRERQADAAGNRPASAGSDADDARNNASRALIRLYTNGIADDRIEKASRLLADDQLTVNEKLTKIDALIPFPATTSAEQLGEMFGVTKQAVLKTDWWIQNRKGEKENEIGRRRAGHQKRAKEYEKPGAQNDDDQP
ncbi:MAG TPA: hypothetical protein VGY66_26065 [Gemmataceae bacterium]|jgi:hypothetical protein|nr:hypothetical protein [Gemmataceae bacterium]